MCTGFPKNQFHLRDDVTLFGLRIWSNAAKPGKGHRIAKKTGFRLLSKALPPIGRNAFPVFLTTMAFKERHTR